MIQNSCPQCSKKLPAGATFCRRCGLQVKTDPASGITSTSPVGHPEQVELERRVVRKIMWRIIPVMCFLYLFNYLDRVNIGYAKLQMPQTLPWLTASVFGFAAGIFFVGYFLFEVPSNLIMQRVGARRWMARIMVSWGLVSAATAFVTEPWHFHSLRLLLGIAEAGFFPGML